MDVDPERQGCIEECLAPGIPTTGMLVQESVDLAEGIERSTKLLQLRVQIQSNAVSQKPFPPLRGKLYCRRGSSVLILSPSKLYSAASQLDNIAAREFSLLAQQQSALAQKSNELNLRIATSTKKDSIAMMAFTFVSIPNATLESYSGGSTPCWPELNVMLTLAVHGERSPPYFSQEHTYPHSSA
jgi:hypothetical protein